MIRLQPHRVGKAESLFVANLKPFFDSIGHKRTQLRMIRLGALAANEPMHDSFPRAAPAGGGSCRDQPQGLIIRGQNSSASLSASILVNTSSRITETNVRPASSCTVHET